MTEEVNDKTVYQEIDRLIKAATQDLLTIVRVLADMTFDVLVENVFKLRFQYTTAAANNNTELHV